jgi:hypothetical protein
MIERIRWNWHHFASRTPGLRFRERFRLHQSRRRRSGFDIVRIFYIVGGALLIALSTVLGWLPLLGWGTAILQHCAKMLASYARRAISTQQSALWLPTAES